MANEVCFSATHFYPVTEGARLLLSITIGEGNAGGSAVYFQNALVQELPGSFANLSIAEAGAVLKNTVLTCNTKVKDLNPATNRTSVVMDLTGGPQPMSFPFSIEVSANGGSADYSITFALV